MTVNWTLSTLFPNSACILDKLFLYRTLTSHVTPFGALFFVCFFLLFFFLFVLCFVCLFIFIEQLVTSLCDSLYQNQTYKQKQKTNKNKNKTNTKTNRHAKQKRDRKKCNHPFPREFLFIEGLVPSLGDSHYQNQTDKLKQKTKK